MDATTIIKVLANSSLLYCPSISVSATYLVVVIHTWADFRFVSALNEKMM